LLRICCVDANNTTLAKLEAGCVDRIPIKRLVDENDAHSSLTEIEVGFMQRIIV